MTRFLALELARSHTYDMAPARRDFGYRELVSMHAATERTIAAWRATGERALAHASANAGATARSS
jgi:hypothetical protein